MKHIYTLLALLISTNLSAQVIADWEFSNTDGYNYYPTTNIVRNGEFTYVCSQSIDVLKTAYVFQIDLAGNLVNQDSIHNFNYSILEHKRMVMGLNGSIYLCGNIIDSLQYSKIRLIKYDSLLNRTWDFVYSDTINNDFEVTGLLYSDSEDKIYLIGEEFDGAGHLITVKFDTDGNVLWKSEDTLHSFLNLTSYTIDHSGNVILGGYAFVSGGGEDFVIRKIDTAGVNRWFVSLDGSSHSDDAVMDLCVNDFNEIYASGRFEDSIPHKILKYDESGNQLWIKDINEISLEKIAVDAAGSLYIVGYDSVPDHEFIIYKFDSAGNFKNSYFGNVPGFQAHSGDYFLNIQTNDSAEVYLLNNVDSLTYSKWFIAKLDSSLNLNWSFIYPENIPNPSTASSLYLIDNGFVVAGAVNNFGQLRVLQFHETFITGINAIPENRNLTIWPNPAINVINFEMKEMVNGNVVFKLFDVNSRLVLDEKIRLSNENNFSINLESFQQGLYFFKLQSNDQIYCGKLIVVD